MVARLLDRRLADAESRAIETHIDRCAACRELVSGVARGASASVSDLAVPTSAATGDDDPAPRQVGRYRITGVLGTGAMGTVYAAHDPELDRRIAVKLLRRGMHNDEARRRFAREAQALARVSHPNVVAV